MDGWESRRRRLPGHDWCVIRLAFCGKIAGFEVDTAFFTGNFTPRISIQAAYLEDYQDDVYDQWMPGSFDRFEKGGGVRGSKSSVEMIEKAEVACVEHAQHNLWHTLIPMTKLKPGYEDTRMHYFSVEDKLLKKKAFTHIRVNYYPDGGVARLKAFGSVDVDFERDVLHRYASEEEVPIMDLASMGLGGRGLACSNKHFGVPRNLLKPGRGIDMGDGWETARHLERPSIIMTNPETGLVDTDLGDWCIIQLGTITGLVEKIDVDTCHFKGNFPESVKIEAGYATHIANDDKDQDDMKIDDLSIEWFPLLERTKLGPDQIFSYKLKNGELVRPPDYATHISHVRVSIYPDGGISRVRIYGKPKRVKSDTRQRKKLKSDTAHVISDL